MDAVSLREQHILQCLDTVQFVVEAADGGDTNAICGTLGIGMESTGNGFVECVFVTTYSPNNDSGRETNIDNTGWCLYDIVVGDSKGDIVATITVTYIMLTLFWMTCLQTNAGSLPVGTMYVST